MFPPALAEAILADPDDRAAYLVLADWLEEQGDPRAALIRMQVAPRIHGMPKPERKMLHVHRAELLGPLARYAQTLTWAHGFVRIAQLPAEGLAVAFAHPSCRFLVELHAAITTRSVAELAAHAPTSLRGLGLRTEAPSPIALAPLAPWLRRLASLRLTGPFLVAGTTLPAAGVVQLHWPDGFDASAELAGLAAVLPARLEQLSIRCSRAAPQAVIAALAGVEVENLALAVPHPTEACAAFAALPLAPTLTSLDLRGGPVTTATVEALVAARPVLPKLELVNVLGCGLVHEQVVALETLGIDVYVERYDEAGE